MAGRGLLPLADDLLDLCPHGLERDVEALERLGGDAFAFVDQTQEDVLGADVVVVEQACFLLREDHHPSGPIGEPFEHVYSCLIEMPRCYPRPLSTGTPHNASLCVSVPILSLPAAGFPLRSP